MCKAFQEVDEAAFATILEHFDLLKAFLFLEDFCHSLETLLLKSISASVELLKLHLIILQNGLGDHLATFWAETAVGHVQDLEGRALL